MKTYDLNARSIQEHLRKLANTSYASQMQGFFKNSLEKQFLGISTKILHDFSKKHQSLALPEIQILLRSPYNEERLLALLILRLQMTHNSESKKEIFNFYLKNIDFVNEWNLVDSSAYQIIGTYLIDQELNLLKTLAQSNNLWHRRISIVSTLAMIRQKDFKPTFELVIQLQKDPEDLIHKACGWMLREIEKRDSHQLKKFLEQHKKNLPRTTLRYAIERLPKLERNYFLTSSRRHCH